MSEETGINREQQVLLAKGTDDGNKRKGPKGWTSAFQGFGHSSGYQ
jgi:hypothetical protein